MYVLKASEPPHTKIYFHMHKVSSPEETGGGEKKRNKRTEWVRWGADLEIEIDGREEPNVPCTSTDKHAQVHAYMFSAESEKMAEIFHTERLILRQSFCTILQHIARIQGLGARELGTECTFSIKLSHCVQADERSIYYGRQNGSWPHR